MKKKNTEAARASALRLCHDLAFLRGDGDLAQSLAALGEVVVGKHAGPRNEAVRPRLGALRDGPVGLDTAVDLDGTGALGEN